MANPANHDSLFGPNIGVVTTGPAWTQVNTKKVVTDELTPDVVKSWIAKSKQSTHPTTTLQALVNLKRPTLRLSPIALATIDDTPTDPHHHGLEFEYDCDAPKCGIYLHVLLSPDHPQAHSSPATSLSRILVFESVVPGGFGKMLTIDEGASLELGRFEHSPHVLTNTSNLSVHEQPIPASDSSPSTPTTLEPPGRNDRRRRFTNFAFRKSRQHSRTVSGPALAVVDAEPVPPTDAKKDEQVDEGVRVVIRLAALDEQGTELASPNEQVTYLHVVRFGAAPAEGEDDARPWVVKVVKREATIGPHTFHLHEIYGLSSTPSQPQPSPTPIPPTSAAALTTHTYPPTTPANPAVSEEEPSSECLVCLSSPREVVLLPCRHLVACKDCALNMVEFGAGGTIVQADTPAVPATATVTATETVASGGDAEAGAPEVGGEGEGAAPVMAPPPPPLAANTRRKRKAKGWFCPVCRQPYTSLLRITTSPPEKDDGDDKREDAAPAVAGAPEAQAQLPAAAPRSGGGLSAFRPAFLRVPRSRPVPDLEAGQA